MVPLVQRTKGERSYREKSLRQALLGISCRTAPILGDTMGRNRDLHGYLAMTKETLL